MEVHIVLGFMWLKWPECLHRSVKTAERKLELLRKKPSEEDRKEALQKDQHEMQLSFINLDDPLLEELRDEITDLDIDTLTPVEA